MIKRQIFEEIKAHLEKKEISFIVGPRQAGKTTLMLLLKEFLEKNGQKTVFFNLDIEADRQFFVSQQALLKKIQLETGEDKTYVFIDEIQRKINAGVFLKGLYDMNLPYKFIVSGSGSVELKERIHESLVGRKRIFNLSVLSFLEFVNYRTDYRYEAKLADYFSLEKGKTKQLLEEYLVFGGYPRVVLAKTQEEKQREINEIYQSYLERDITLFLRVEKTEAFSQLVRLLAGQVGLLINLSELSNTLGISVKTVKDYLWYLEKTFIIEKISPFFRNLRKEITKSPVVYFHDLGLRNYSLNNFLPVQNQIALGFLFQNFVFNFLKQNIEGTSSYLHFWRTKDRAEVDFVLEKGLTLIPIEVKFKEMRKPEINRGLRSFLEKYRPEKAFIVNLTLQEKIQINRTEVNILPVSSLFFEKNF